MEDRLDFMGKNVQQIIIDLKFLISPYGMREITKFKLL